MDSMMDNDKGQESAPAGIRLDDIYFVLFRRKWLILAFSALGLAAAATVYFLRTPLFQSEAKLLVRYIQESRAVSTVDKDVQITAPDNRADSLINSELEILNSFDLASEVA